MGSRGDGDKGGGEGGEEGVGMGNGKGEGEGKEGSVGVDASMCPTLLTLALTLAITHAHALFAPLTSPLVPIPSTTRPPHPRPPLSHRQERTMWVAMVMMEMTGWG